MPWQGGGSRGLGVMPTNRPFIRPIVFSHGCPFCHFVITTVRLVRRR
jgi:hypothetical protein